MPIWAGDDVAALGFKIAEEHRSMSLCCRYSSWCDSARIDCVFNFLSLREVAFVGQKGGGGKWGKEDYWGGCY